MEDVKKVVGFLMMIFICLVLKIEMDLIGKSYTSQLENLISKRIGGDNESADFTGDWDNPDCNSL